MVPTLTVAQLLQLGVTIIPVQPLQMAYTLTVVQLVGRGDTLIVVQRILLALTHIVIQLITQVVIQQGIILHLIDQNREARQLVVLGHMDTH
jgi:hypothetical protein